MEEYAQAALAYKKATELKAEAQPAWKGLVELYTKTQEGDSLVDSLEHLVSHSLYASSLTCLEKLALKVTRTD